MASSAPSERLFSRAALIFTDHCNHLGEAGEAQVLTSAAARSGMDLGKLLEADDASKAASQSAAKRQKAAEDGAAASSSRSGEGDAPMEVPAPTGDVVVVDNDVDDVDDDDEEDNNCFALDVSAAATPGAEMKDPVTMTFPGAVAAPPTVDGGAR